MPWMVPMGLIELPSTEGGCPHLKVEPTKWHADGSIDGRCTTCGEDGFPLRDVGDEHSLRDDAVELAELQGTPVMVRVAFKDAVVEDLAHRLLCPVAAKFVLTEQEAWLYRCLQDLDRRLAGDAP